MIVRKITSGGRKHITEYPICNDSQKTGDRPEEVIRVDTMEMAALLLRYFQGGFLSQADRDRVTDALRHV